MSELSRAMMVILALAVMTTASCAANMYYLSPDGDDEAAGTREAPWQTLQQASETAAAGDTVILLPGRYEGQLRPVNSGTEQGPITFRSETRHAAELVGTGDGSPAILLEDIAYLRFEGLYVSPYPDRGTWLYAQGCSHLTFEDCRMEDSVGGLSIHFEDSEHIYVRDSIFQRQHRAGDMFRLTNCSHLLLEGNTISRAAHSPFNLRPDHGGTNIVVRGNVFHSAWGRAFEFFGSQDVLFEHNIIAHSFNSGRSGSANSKFATTRGIFRFNRVFHNPHGSIHLYPFRDVWLDTICFYNNVFDHNGNYGIAVSSNNDQSRDIVFSNNIFSRNDPHGNERQIQLRGGVPEQTRLLRNVFSGSEPDLPLVQDYGDLFTVEALESQEMREEHGARYLGNLQIDPGYVNPDIYDHALRADSPLRNAGIPLARALTTDEGNLLAVDDTTPFYDGYGLEGEVGDLIAVGAADRIARVVQIDHEDRTLLLDRDVTWQQGDPVSLPWSGEAPDIGVYEHGDQGRVSVQAVAEPFEVLVDEEVTLRAVVHGAAQPRHFRWCLGDGNVAEGAEITHAWDEAYDYAVRVRMTDADGRHHYGPGYVVVSEPDDPTAPLIHSTWNRDDNSSWWLWKTYRPRPVTFRDIVDEETGRGFRHVVAQEDQARLPAQINPIDWDIDRYPRVFIRYRMGEGTPLAIHLRTFAGNTGVVAASPGAEVRDDARLADHVLHDDGQWHEIEFDVRVIREIEPDVNILERMHIIDTPRSAVREGHFFDLDEVIIGPEVDG